MNRILFIDNEKKPDYFGLPLDTTWATSVDEAIRYFEIDTYMTLYLDYDLGNPEKNGAWLLREMCKWHYQPAFVYIISLNEEGVRAIREVCNEFLIPNLSIGHLLLDKFPIIDGQSG